MLGAALTFLFLLACDSVWAGDDLGHAKGDGPKCKKYFLPEDEVEVNRHVDTIMRESEQSFTNVSTSFCVIEGERGAAADMSLLKEAVAEMRRGAEERRRRREASRDEAARTLDIMKKIIYDNFRPRDRDCQDLVRKGVTASGVYPIYPGGGTRMTPASCDMTTGGGGWTVILSRLPQPDLQLDFSRNWTEYRNGFGEPEAEYWLGNEALHRLTRDREHEVRLEATDEAGETVWGEWRSFRVDSDANKYRLSVGNFSEESTAYADQLSDVHGMPFSTFDQLNDPSDDANCPLLYKGGWWYNRCFLAHPTGVYESRQWEGIVFIRSWSRKDIINDHYARSLQIKIRPLQ